MYNISISSPNMKYLSNKNNNHFFIKRKLKASICTGKWTKEDDIMYYHIMCGSWLCKKQSLRLSFQFSPSNAHVTSCLARIHKPKKALETKVNEIKGREKKAIQTKKHMKLNEEKRRSQKWLWKSPPWSNQLISLSSPYCLHAATVSLLTPLLPPLPSSKSLIAFTTFSEVSISLSYSLCLLAQKILCSDFTFGFCFND